MPLKNDAGTVEQSVKDGYKQDDQELVWSKEREWIIFGIDTKILSALNRPFKLYDLHFL